MAYSDSFPTQRPIFTLDAANAGRLDSRISYSRSTTGSFYGKDKHLSSENLLLQSSDFDTTWYNQGLSAKTGGQTDPSGGTDGFTLVEDGAAAFHRLSQSPTATGELALTVYAKRNSGTRYLNLTFGSSGGGSLGSALATFDLAGGATHTANGSNSTLTNLSATQTASGNGYYKCVFKATASASITTAQISLSNTATPAANNYGLVYYTGDNSSSLDIAFASLTTTGATDYNATTTQIHREYAPTLQTAAINAPRFEFSATDSASEVMGQSRGLLIEGQSTNLNPYSDALASWGTNNALTLSANAGVGPDGSLGADLIVANTAYDTHYIRSAVITVSAGSAYTFSGYFKSLNGEKLRLVFFQSAAPFTGEAGAVFTLTGSGSAAASAGSASITSVGNGYYRCTVTGTTLTTGSYLQIQTVSTSDSQVYVGNAYNGVLCAGIQFELGSFASSPIATNGSAATRAADSASADTSSFYTGGPVTVVSETTGGQGNFPIGWAVRNSSGGDSLQIYKASGSATTDSGWRVYATVAGVNTVATTINSSASAGKIAVSFDTNDVAFTASGNAVQTDTSTALISGVNQLAIGGVNNQEINGHVKRIALYGEALSDTNLQALTS